MIGGDSVLSIRHRIFFKSPNSVPSYEEVYQARIDAEDLFEVKVDIVETMAVLDERGDWKVSGARALDNPRTATGEESLERLHSIFDDLKQNGKKSQAFVQLKSKMLKEATDWDRGSTS